MFARELVSGNSGTEVLGLLGSVAQTFTAAGTTQATATAITAVKTFITTATEGQGAILPGTMNPGDEGVICNSTTVDVYIYPPVGYKINGATVNIPVLLPPQRTCRFTCVDGNNYMITV